VLEHLADLQQEALQNLAAAEQIDDLESWRIAYLGKKGALTKVLRGLGGLSPEERPVAGKRANELKQVLEAAFDARQESLRAAAIEADLATGALDVTLPGRKQNLGRLHPSTQILREITAIFAEMGFQVYRSRDVELDEYNFRLLNIPPHHPARDMQDTFYVDDEVLLRTQTSPGQIHAMREFAPDPIRIILPGMCYRYEQITARSEIQFNQVEGLAVGHNITMADLKGTLVNFTRRMFGEERQLRFRCSHFPFTEPSVEVDMDCIACQGKGCRLCKQSGWLEILGAGMVHPVVLRNGGYDPDVYTGFAFGIGPERIAMLKYRIEDIRYFWANDLRFLEQFG